MQRTRRVLVAAALSVLGTGCPSAEPPPTFASAASPADLRARTSLHLETIDFLKPDSSEARTDPYLAPILYRDVVESDAGSGFGALVARPDGLGIDRERPTIYHSRTRVLHGDVEHEQVSYFWFVDDLAAGRDAVQGLRMTFDSAGFPAIFEVLRDSSGLQLFYVTRALEDAAASQFAQALDGREHVVEPDSAERPDVVVARIVVQGPEPLGPILYDAPNSDDVFNLHCRCTSSQITNIRKTIDYALAPWSEVPADVRATVAAAVGDASAAGNELPGFQPAEWPLVSLRLPDSF